MGKVRIQGEDTNIDIANGGVRMDTGSGVARGEYIGESAVNKFGSAPDFDTGDLSVTIWDGADDADINQMNYVYSTTSDINAVSSNNTGDTGTLNVVGLGPGYVACDQTVTLSGTSLVSLATTMLRVFRMKNTSTTSNIGHVYCYVTTALTSGKPDDMTYLRAVIQPKLNQTLMSIYTVPAGKTATMDSWFAGEGGAKKTTNYVIDIKARKQGECFQLKHRSSISDSGTGHLQHEYKYPLIFTEKTDIEMKAQITAGAITSGVVVAGFSLGLETS